MTNCKEFVLDDVMAVTAIPVADYNPADMPDVFASGVAPWLLAPVIPSSQFAPPLGNSITIGLQPAADGGTLIPIIRMSGKAADEENDQTAGRLHKVTVNAQVDERDTAVWEYLLVLERTSSHLLLTFRDQSRAFVQGGKDTYLCTVSRDGAKTSVQFRIECLMGIQTIV